MSLIFVKNDDDSVRSGRHTSLLPYRFSNFFTQPIQIAPNSQIAYVSSTFKMNTAGYIEADPFYALIGSPQMNATIPLYVPKTSVDSWTREINFLGALVNSYGTDGNYNDIYNSKEFVEGVEQTEFETGNNFLITNTDKVKIRTTQRGINDVFNQGFNCCGANGSITYVGTGGNPNLTYGAGINTGTGDNKAFYLEVLLEAVNPSLHPNRMPLPTQIGNELAGDSVIAIDTEQNFYNTQYAYNKIDDDTYDFANNSALNYFWYNAIPFDEGYYPTLVSNTPIKQNVNIGSVPTDNGGGHASISDLDKFSGGYAIHTFRNVAQGIANTHYDLPYLEVGENSDVGFTGISPQFFGVHSTEFIYGNAGNPDLSKARFTDNMDLNNAIYGVADGLDPSEPYGAWARYLMGVKIYETAGTLIAQVQVLDPHATLTESKYIDVGFPLDIYKLSKGVIPNPADGNDFEYENNADYHINTHNTTAGKDDAQLYFRFRWTSPYTMAVEYTLSAPTKHPNSYNPITDAPYDFADVNGLENTETPIVNPESVELDNTTDGTTRALTSNTTFLDSGGSGGNYQPNELYDMTFDSQINNTCVITINTFETEASTFAMYDRFGIEVSNDGINFVNVSGVPFLQTSSVSTPPYSDSFGGGTSYDDNGSFGTDGYILPSTTARAIELGALLGETITFPYTFDTGYRYVRFNFISDNSQQQAGWNFNLTPSVPYTETTTSFTGDPTEEWITLYDMKNFTGDVAQDSYYIPSYMGDITMVQYPTTEEHSVGRKGHFDLRKSYRYYERINEGQDDANLFSGLSQLPFFNDPYALQSLLRKSNTIGLTTPKLENFEPELFTADGRSTKEIQFLMNEIITDADRQKFKFVSGSPMFNLLQPPKLDLGTITGLIDDEGVNIQSVVLLNNDILGSATKYVLYGYDGVNKITTGNLSFSNHIQIANLPIQSQNGVKSTMNKCVYVINSLNINNTSDIGQSRLYSDIAPTLLWIDLNNYGSIDLNKIDILITTDENMEQKLLKDSTDIVFMIRQKPKDAEGYIPNNIPVVRYN